MAVELVSGNTTWSGNDLNQEDLQTCVLQLLEDDVEDIKEGLHKFKELGLDQDSISKTTFKLMPPLGTKLESCARAIHDGKGFCIVRGLEASKYSAEDGISMFLGLASHIADQRGIQDRKGNILSHITSSKLWTTPTNQRHGIHSNLSLPFHNDMGCDILALHCCEKAVVGGSTYISSAATVFNLLSAKEPQVIETLLSPNWPVQISGDRVHHYLAPAFTIHNGRLMSCMDPHRFGRHPQSVNFEVPDLTASQIYALQRVSDTAHQVELEVKLEAGDNLFFNNWAIIHRREAYTDGEATTRHLVRLWLRNNELGWTVPRSMSIPFEAAYGKDTMHIKRRYQLKPENEYKLPKYTAGSAAFMLDDDN